jgi:hypothetical protein
MSIDRMSSFLRNQQHALTLFVRPAGRVRYNFCWFNFFKRNCQFWFYTRPNLGRKYAQRVNPNVEREWCQALKNLHRFHSCVGALWTYCSPSSRSFSPAPVMKAKGRSASPDSHYGASSHELKKGTRVLILNNDNVSQRAPQYIGQVGVVKDVPVHPATWFKIQFSDGQTMTFRPTALEVVSDDFVPLPPVARVIGTAPARPTTSPVKRPRGEEDSDDRDTGDDKKKKKGNSNGAKLKEDGTKPMSVDDESQDTATVADSESASTTPSVHSLTVNTSSQVLLNSIDPDTWVGKIVMVRGGKDDGLSGKVLRSGNGWVQVATKVGEFAKRAYDLYVIGEGSPPSKKTNDGFNGNGSNARTGARPASRNGDSKRPGIKSEGSSFSDADTFTRRTGNGKLRVGEDGMYDNGGDMVAMDGAFETKEDGDRTRVRTRSYSDSFNNYVVPPHLDGSTGVDDSNNKDSSTIPSESPALSSGNEMSPITTFPTSSGAASFLATHGTRNRGRADVEDYLKPFCKPRSADAARPVNRIATANAKKGKGGPNQANSRTNLLTQRGINAMQAAAVTEDTAALPSNGPLISAQAIALKRLITQKFVDRCNEKLKDRPDLGYWLSLVRGRTVDTEYELSMATDPLNIYCTHCKVEFWPGAQFCWNEWCPASQVFYKLKGARGSAPTSPKLRSVTACPPCEMHCAYLGIVDGELVYTGADSASVNNGSTGAPSQAEAKTSSSQSSSSSSSADLKYAEHHVNAFLWDAPKVSLQYDCFLNAKKT